MKFNRFTVGKKRIRVGGEEPGKIRLVISDDAQDYKEVWLDKNDMIKLIKRLVESL